VIINILSYESEQELIQTLRDEIEHVQECANGSWPLASLDKMHRLDSVVRETLRLDGFDGVSLHRLVKGGITREDGLVLQKGTKIGVSSYSIHRDEVQYPDGMKFDPFRFPRTSR
jgi:cytochrome P450